MWAYVVRKILYNIPVYMGIILIVMLALRVNDPVWAFLGKNATQAQYDAKKKEVGLDRPFLVQYAQFMGKIVTLDFSTKSWDKPTDSVGKRLGTALVPTLSITIPEFGLTSMIGIFVGLVAAYFRGRLIDRSMMFFAVLGMSISALVYIVYGQTFGAYRLNEWVGHEVFAISGFTDVYTWVEWQAPGMKLTGWIGWPTLALSLGSLAASLGLRLAGRRVPRWIWGAAACGLIVSIVLLLSGSTIAIPNPSPRNWARCCALPVMIGIVVAMGYDTRFYRAVMVEETTRDYIATAKAKGASKPKIMFVHMLKNAMIPIITRVMITVPFLIEGGILLERYFQIPGMGYVLIDAINAKDFPIIQTFAAVFAAIFIITNILTDVLYALVDPRVRLA